VPYICTAGLILFAYRHNYSAWQIFNAIMSYHIWTETDARKAEH